MIQAYPVKKGTFNLTIWAQTSSGTIEEGKLKVTVDASECPELDAPVVVRHPWVWILDQEGRYCEVRGSTARDFLTDVADLLKPGGIWYFRYTDDELVHRALRLMRERKISKRLAERLARLLREGRREEARALLLSKELSLLEGE